MGLTNSIIPMIVFVETDTLFADLTLMQIVVDTVLNDEVIDHIHNLFGVMIIEQLLQVSPFVQEVVAVIVRPPLQELLDDTYDYWVGREERSSIRYATMSART